MAGRSSSKSTASSKNSRRVEEWAHHSSSSDDDSAENVARRSKRPAQRPGSRSSHAATANATPLTAQTTSNTTAPTSHGHWRLQPDGDLNLTSVPDHLLSQIQQNKQTFSLEKPSCVRVPWREDPQVKFLHNKGRSTQFVIPGTNEPLLASRFVCRGSEIVIVQQTPRSRVPFNNAQAAIVIPSKIKTSTANSGPRMMWWVWDPAFAANAYDKTSPHVEKLIAQGPIIPPSSAAKRPIQDETTSKVFSPPPKRPKRAIQRPSITRTPPQPTREPHFAFLDPESPIDTETIKRRIPLSTIDNATDLFHHALCNGLITPRIKILELRYRGATFWVLRDYEEYFHELVDKVKAQSQTGNVVADVVVVGV